MENPGKLTFLCGAALICALWIPFQARAAAGPGEHGKIPDLLRELCAEEAGRRNAACRQLLALGAPAYQALKAALPADDPEADLQIRTLVFRMAPFHGSWIRALEAARGYSRKGACQKSMTLFLVAAKKHPPLRRDKWYAYLTRKTWDRLTHSERKEHCLEDWGLFVTGQHDRLVREHPSSPFRPDSLFRLGRYTQLLRDHPASSLAPYAQYSLVSGHPYFEPPTFVDIHSPDDEILKWPVFIKTNPGHPGLDDAAYRLGRAYELKGNFRSAVKHFHQSTVLPDGEYKVKGRMRLLYLIDAVCPFDDLGALSREAPTAEVRSWAALTAGIRLFRSRRFEKARKVFQTVLAARPNPPHGNWIRKRLKDLDERILPLWKRSKQTEGGDRALYELGRIYYHDLLANYNPIWQGGRVAYLSYQVNALGRTHAFDHAAYFEEHNNYLSAASFFERLLKLYPSSPLADKALYSAGTCYLKAPALNHFAQFSRPREEMLAMARSFYERLIRGCPSSPLVKDARRMAQVIEDLPQDWMRY